MSIVYAIRHVKRVTMYVIHTVPVYEVVHACVLILSFPKTTVEGGGNVRAVG